MKEKFTSNNAPIPSPHIAQVSMSKELGIAYISGLISQKPDGEVICGTSVAEQTEVIMENLSHLLADMGLTMDHIIKANVFIKSMDCFDEMNDVYKRYFNTENPPARQCVAAGIWGNLDVEISFVAAL